MLPLAFVFGGCCSNVLSLENLVQTTGISSTLVTFAQFLVVSGISYFLVADLRNGLYLPKSNLPLKVHFLQNASFFVTNILNNLVFQFGISVPVHIVLRSSGTPITMLVGWGWFHKRYTRQQILGAIVLTTGVIIVTLTTTKEKNEAYVHEAQTANLRKLVGVSLLFFSTAIGCVMGLFTERTYLKYGKSNWKQNLFYSHFYGLPLFLFVVSTLRSEITRIMNEPPTTQHVILKYLSINCVTQFLCVYGVNQLASSTNALNVSIILLLRKFASLMISMAVFGNRLNAGSAVGIALVFVGTLVYSRGQTAIGGEKKDSNVKNK
ncbi:unnamed protein product [Kuraishia capsulata CBS 1993]|uniref:Sugar phosphate transporter domain-containing protein n=1 Tax=Kuraishia capsulata CBS 1993 TaxID=1382522 RepID=W6MUV0_9ASCO|nr:uncharacterized protein KUCA_T00001906001 [Kuraishia capsulata CBS 1993]CDK25935.1 unnamed protein product [Kuraishia capsulata CBS 1993]